MTKKNSVLISATAGDEKNLSPGGRKKSLFINLIEFLKKSLHYKTTLTELFLVKKQGAGKKRKFVRINLLMEFFLFLRMFFWNKKYIFSYTFSYIFSCGRVGDKKKFHPADFRKQDYFFLPYLVANRYSPVFSSQDKKTPRSVYLPVNKFYLGKYLLLWNIPSCSIILLMEI